MLAPTGSFCSGETLANTLAVVSGLPGTGLALSAASWHPSGPSLPPVQCYRATHSVAIAGGARVVARHHFYRNAGTVAVPPPPMPRPLVVDRHRLQAGQRQRNWCHVFVESSGNSSWLPKHPQPLKSTFAARNTVATSGRTKPSAPISESRTGRACAHSAPAGTT